MKALSLRQPWAWAVIHAGKSIENRYWNTRLRGEFLIHAAKGMTRIEYAQSKAWIEDVLSREPDGVLLLGTMPRHEDIPRGGIVGRARLVDVIPPLTPIEDMTGSRTYPDGVNEEWHMTDQHGFVLADVRALPFTPWKGELGFFDVPEVDARAILARTT